MEFQSQHDVQLATVTKHLINEDFEAIAELIFPAILENSYLYHGSALEQAMRVDIDTFYEENIQRVLNQLRYDKTEDYLDAEIIRCSDGMAFIENRDFNIFKNTGMCYELAAKCGAHLKMMYPDRLYCIGHDKSRPSGWNHYFVFEIVDSDTKYVIDASKNKQGFLHETGQWDGSGVNYLIDEMLSIHNPDNMQFASVQTVIEIKGKEHGTNNKLPLLSPPLR